MKLTRAGRGLALMALLTLAAAVSSGNNLLYLLYSSALAALLVSWILGKFNLSSIYVRIQTPEQVFRGIEFPVSLYLERKGLLPSFLLKALRGETGPLIDRLSPSKPVKTDVRVTAELRGFNQINGLRLESSFPFGLILHTKKIAPVIVTAYPITRQIRSPQEIASMTEAGGELTLRRGNGEEFFGIREYTPSDDIRWINWKLTAKTGRALITEFAAPVGAKMTVRLDSVGSGPEAELRIDEAASACRFFIDAGAEVRLVTPETKEDYGRGLLHLDRLLLALALLGEGKIARPSNPTNSKTAPQLELNAVFLRRLTWLGAMLICVSMLLIDEIPLWLPGVMGGILLFSLWSQEHDGPWVPKPLWDILSLLVLAYVALTVFNLSGIILTNTYLVLYLLGNRLLNPLSNESLGQTFVILFLAFFLISGQTISLWYFLSFLAFGAFAVLWVVISSGADPARWRLWTPALSSACLILFIATAITFAATPRFETWSQRNPLVAAIGLDKLRTQSSAITGFTDNVTLGYFGQLKSSAARVIRVKPHLTKPIASPPPLYVRGGAFDAFDGKHWDRSHILFDYIPEYQMYRQHSPHRAKLRTAGHNRVWMRRQGTRIVFPPENSPQPQHGMEFTVFPMNTSALFTVGRPSEMVGIDGTVGFDATDSLYSSAPHFAGIQYSLFESADPPNFANVIRSYPQIVRTYFLQVPNGITPRTLKLARTITSGLKDDTAKAHAIEAYLKKNYSYSTFSKSANTTLEDFLFSVKSGNCEYFATAGVILLRLEGIPARLATGFLAQNWNEFGLFYDVRQNEAHAWVEAYINRKWIRLDPTPGEAFSFRNNIVDRLSRVFNAVQARWYEKVIGYDSYVQRNTFYRFGMASARQALEKIVRWALYLTVGISVLFSLGSLYLWALRRLRAQRGPYFRAQAALERKGFNRAAYETPKEFARLVSQKRPSLRAIEELAEWHYREFYGKRRLSAEEHAKAESLLKELLSLI